MTVLVVGGVLLLMLALALYFLGRSDGRHAEKAAQLNRQIKAAEKIADAQANAPTTRDQLVDRLRNGGGL